MIHDIYSSLLEEAQYHAVNPLIFIVLYLVTWPMVWHSWYVLVRAHAKGDSKGFRRGVWYNRIATFTPYLYVLFFGINFPIWLVPSSIAVMLILAAMFRFRLGSGLLEKMTEKVGSVRKMFTRLRTLCARRHIDSE